ncbi:MAG TPA: UDP-2,3-diacylglucosamine hydrolase [Gammaproteobacteria bacterium]|nr:UDP-2,3-diacylglucosamine hydrolase [Gammaproteobacteria bacterium]
MEKLKFNTVFISDVHLGLRSCKAEFLLDFLQHIVCKSLYLVGDIIDFWHMKKGVRWPALHNRVIQEVMCMAARGTRVIYVPGNHDELFRDYLGTSFGGIEMHPEVVHRTADGREFLVLHGDEFDHVVKHSRWIAVLGSEAYDFLLAVNRWFNLFRRKLGFPYWSLSAFVKHKVKNAVCFISNFEKAVVHEAHKRGVDGVICGHIHKATIENYDGVLYCNDGDWVESCTALVEHPDGALAVIHWADESVFLLNENEHAHSDRDRRLAPTG